MADFTNQGTFSRTTASEALIGDHRTEIYLSSDLEESQLLIIYNANRRSYRASSYRIFYVISIQTNSSELQMALVQYNAAQFQF